MVLLATLVLVALPIYAQQQGFRSSDLHNLRSVDDVQLSPDGSTILYSITSREGLGRSSSRLWMYGLEDGSTRQLLEGSGSSARWSPDGSFIAYIGALGDRSGLIVVRADGSDPRLLTEVSGTNHPLPSSGERLTWAPDGSAIAFVSTTPGPESAEATGDPVVVTRYLYKPTASEGLTRFNDNRRAHIFVVEVASGNVTQLTEGVYYEHSLHWSPDGEEILFISNRETNPDKFFNYDIFTVRVDDQSIRRLTRTENAEYRPRWSPDGSMVVYQGTRRGLTSSETTMEDTHIWVMNSDGSNRREVGQGIDNRQGAPQWAADGRSIFCTVQESGSVGLHQMDVDGHDHNVVVGEPGGVGSWSLGSRGVVVYSFQSARDMAQLFIRDNRGSRQLTDVNRDLLDRRFVGEMESLRFVSFDGREVEAFFTYPRGLQEGSSHPLITMIKGGPHGQRGPRFDHKAQVYAAQGWAVLTVNYRGSTGYGQAFSDAIFGDQNGGEAKDVIYGVLAAVRRFDWIDRDRLGIEGGSYGGQLTNWIITQTDMFAAAIPIASISNLISFNYMAYYHDYLAVEFGAYPHQEDLMDLLWERSALKHVAKVRTPTMLVHGENDNDVPIAEAEQFYIALHDVGVPAVMVRYPREGHGVRETGHVVDLIDRSTEWYRRWFN
ncbi:prolyl oligopeptidase family serine peptidase [Gemmatimonadota bacterium]